MRAIPQLACSNNENPDDVRGIVRYGASTADPTSIAYAALDNDTCVDVAYSNLVPHVSSSPVDPTADSDLDVTIVAQGNLFKWQIGLTPMAVEWAEPSVLTVYNSNGTSSFEDDDVVYELPNANEWVYFVISTALAVPHPIHLHGHDFYILAQQDNAVFDSSVSLNLDNPPRRDVANLPVGGYLVIAFLTDNPGAWLVGLHLSFSHCSLRKQGIANTTP